MPPERPNAPAAAEVSLVLMNGQVHTGFISRFTPNVADITLALGPNTKEKMRFAAEQVAYVGFHRAAGEPPARPQSRKASLKIHVCRTPHLATSAEIEELAQPYGPEQFQKLLGRRDELNVQLWHAPGCTACNKSGYKGRLGAHELLISDDDLRRAIQRKAPVDEIRSLAIASGMTTLMQDGIEKVLDGATDLKQVLAVCGR